MSRKRRLALIAICLSAALVLAAWIWSPAARIYRVERAALAQLGKPYVFGTAGLESFDCSGLMKYAYSKANVTLAHNTRIVASDDQYTTISDPSRLRQGDLVYFNTVSNTTEIDHVGLWLGRNRFIHASSANGEVMISEFDERWQQRFVLAKRILYSRSPGLKGRGSILFE